MYSLHDQLKTIETAEMLSNPLESEYKKNFVDWSVYGTASREDAYLNNKEAIDLTPNTPNRIGHNRRRRGSWSAPVLPSTLKWLEDIDVNNNKSSATRDGYNKKQSSVLNNVTANGYGYDDNNNNNIRQMMPRRPTTSAEFRDYGNNNNNNHHHSSS